MVKVIIKNYKYIRNILPNLLNYPVLKITLLDSLGY